MHVLATDLGRFDQFSDSPYHGIKFMNCGTCHQPLSSHNEGDIRNLSCTSHTSSIVVFGSGTCRYELDIDAVVLV